MKRYAISPEADLVFNTSKNSIYVYIIATKSFRYLLWFINQEDKTYINVTIKLNKKMKLKLKNILKLYLQFRIIRKKKLTYLAILRKPQDAVACKGVQPSLSPRFTSASCSIKNSTISRLSSIQAWNNLGIRSG